MNKQIGRCDGFRSLLIHHINIAPIYCVKITQLTFSSPTKTGIKSSAGKEVLNFNNNR